MNTDVVAFDAFKGWLKTYGPLEIPTTKKQKRLNNWKRYGTIPAGLAAYTIFAKAVWWFFWAGGGPLFVGVGFGLTCVGVLATLGLLINHPSDYWLNKEWYFGEYFADAPDDPVKFFVENNMVWFRHAGTNYKVWRMDGVPHYLEQVKPTMTLSQAMDEAETKMALTSRKKEAIVEAIMVRCQETR